MKKPYILILLCTLLLLTGCKSKTSFSLTFDEFTMKIYDNNKQYTALKPDASTVGLKVLTELKEKTAEGDTGFINSLIIVTTPVQSGINMKALVDSNNKKLQLQLLKYKNIDTDAKKVKCNAGEYSGYTTAFSYQLEKQTLYDVQYFFTDDTVVYLLSFTSDDEDDIQNFIKSVETIKCKS